MKKRLLSLLLAALLLLSALPAARADGALSTEEEVLALFAQQKEAGTEEFDFTCDRALFESLMADNARLLSILQIKGGIASARVLYGEQSCLIRLTELRYTDAPWAECAGEEEACLAIRALLRERAQAFTLLCSPELAKSLAASAILRSYAAQAGFPEITLAYYASGVIQVTDPVPFDHAWAPAEDSGQFDAAVETFSLREEDEFTIVFSPALYEELLADEEARSILHATSTLDRYSYASESLYTLVRYTRASYTPDPSLVCRSREELKNAISHIGALEIPQFRLYLADDGLREELMDTPLAYLHDLENEGGLQWGDMSHNSNFVYYTNAHFATQVKPLAEAGEAEELMQSLARAGAEDISLYCTAELYTALAGEAGAYPEDLHCLDPIYAMIARAGIADFDLALNRPCGAIRVRVLAYTPGLSLLHTAENQAEAGLSPTQREALDTARSLAAHCRGKDPEDTARKILEELSHRVELTDTVTDAREDTALGALLMNKATPKGLADAFFLIAGLAGLELRYPVASPEAGAETRCTVSLLVGEDWKQLPLEFLSPAA